MVRALQETLSVWKMGCNGYKHTELVSVRAPPHTQFQGLSKCTFLNLIFKDQVIVHSRRQKVVF